MTVRATRPPLDATGITLSALCFRHFLAVPLVATGMLAWMASEVIHIGLTIALAGVIVFVARPSYQRHRHAVVPALLGVGLTVLIVAILGEDVLGEYAESGLTALGCLASATFFLDDTYASVNICTMGDEFCGHR